MPRSPLTSKCPCGSAAPFATCCQPLLQGRSNAASAEALMRSRYSAFALGYFDYLVETVHPDNRGDLTAAVLEAQDRHTRWLALEVHESVAGQPGDSEGQVHFTARFLDQGIAAELEERSAFVFIHERWFYTTGEPEFRRLGKPQRNAPCPCGSGKKFKHCPHPDNRTGSGSAFEPTAKSVE